MPNNPQSPKVKCPLCGLVMWDENTPPDEPVCNPIRSPDCWQAVGGLPKVHSLESQVIKQARTAGVNRG